MIECFPAMTSCVPAVVRVSGHCERQLLTVSNWLLAVDASNAHRACGLVTDGRAARPAPEDVGQQNCSCEMIVVGAWLGVGGGRRCCGTLP